MEISTYAQLWLLSCWIAAILFVVGATAYEAYMAVTNREVIAAGEVIRQTIDAQRVLVDKGKQFDMLVRIVNRKPPEVNPADDPPLEISDKTLAELRAVWLLIESESKRLRITPQEFMNRVSKMLEMKEP